MGVFFDDETRRRTLGIRDRQILLQRAGNKCEFCGTPLDYASMQIGHKTAFARGGATSIKNSVVLCYAHNKLQGTDSWAVFLRKMGKEVPGHAEKANLKGLSLSQLQFLAKKWGVNVRGRAEEGLFENVARAPGKPQYVRALAKQAAGKTIAEELGAMPARIAKKRAKKREASWW